VSTVTAATVAPGWRGSGGREHAGRVDGSITIATRSALRGKPIDEISASRA
jgi:hypothetical protein